MRADEVFAKWLDDALRSAGRGAAAKVARETSLTLDKISKSRKKGGRRLQPSEIVEIAVCLGVPLPKAFDQFMGRDSVPDSHVGRERLFQIPLISQVSAGKLTEAVETPSGGDTLTLSGLPGGDYFALRVQGDSMDRISPDGSVVIVNRRERTPQAGRAYVFSVRGEATFKLWQPKPVRLEPYSTNPANRPIFIDRKRDLIVIGRVRRTILDL